MKSSCKDFNYLFFEPNSKLKKELNNPCSYNEFVNILDERINLCKDDNMLDICKLKKLYEVYVHIFNTNKNNFYQYFFNEDKNHRVRMYMIYDDDLWVNTKSNSSKSYFTNRCYKEEYIDELIRERQSVASKESFKKRYGDNWETYFYEYVNKRNESLNLNPNINQINYNKGKSLRVEYYLDKINEKTGELYTIDESKEKIRERQLVGSKICSEKRKGKSGVTCRSVEWWIKKGYTEEESKEKVREIQSTNNIETYIKKYGEQDGIKKWMERNKKWGETMIIKKMESGHVGSAYSKSSKKIFDKVVDKLNTCGYNLGNVYYGEKEFAKWDKRNKRVYFYDFVVPEIKLCVEYNGLMFHPKEGDKNWQGLFSDKSYEEKLKYDKEKIKTIEDCGFTTLVIWEDDDVDLCVQKIVDLYINLKK